MPTPPVIFDANRFLVGKDPYDDTNGQEISTWGKVRSPLIVDYDNWDTGSNSLIVDEGYYPDESLHVRVILWPYINQWFDINGDPQDAYRGPILGWQYYTYGSPPTDQSFMSLGAYNENDGLGNATLTYGPWYNGLDENDVANFFEGRLVNATYTTDATWAGADPVTNPNVYGQDLGAVVFSGYTSISDMTAF